MSEGTMTEPGASPVGTVEDALAGWIRERREPEMISHRRREAWERYASEPMPSRRSEEWRYTDLGDLDPASFDPVGTDGQRAGSIEELPGAVAELIASERTRSAIMVQRNGAVVHVRLDPELAAKGVLWAPIPEVAETRPEILEQFLFGSEVAPSERKLWALHVATLSNGYVLHVPAGVSVPHPVQAIRYLDAGGALVSSHSLIVAGAGAEVTVIDEYLSPDLETASLSLNGVEIFGDASAVVRYLALQRYGRGVKHFSMQHANTGRDSTLNGLNVTLGADLARCDVSSHLQGPGAESEMLALWFGDADQHFDHHTLQNHVAPHARSDLLYKGALTDRGRSIFRGLIRVAKGAQLTDAYQTNRNLLLSDDAKATALPNLEIAADDVRCSHGATVGQVDETHLFYLMSRGLSRPAAERLLVLGFFDEVLGRVPFEGVRERIRATIEEKIGLPS